MIDIFCERWCNTMFVALRDKIIYNYLLVTLNLMSFYVNHTEVQHL